MQYPPTYRRAGVMVALVLGLAALSLPASALSAETPPTRSACPEVLSETATCYSGQDDNGAYYAVAIPDDWNGSLVVHAHGGPGLTEGSDPSRSPEDLERWAVMVQEGYAWAGSAYRRGGYGAQMAAIDTENLRRLFVANWGEPSRTLLHGQSWGGNVAAKVAETFANDPGRPYDGALLTNGVLAGGSRGYDYRVDLRVVYQYYCGNHPRPAEPQYPLWMGLHPDSTMTSSDLRTRLQECTGYQSTPAERTALQQQNLDDILAVARIPERTLESHLRFATFTFRDIVNRRLDGRNPFGNETIHYTGSHDDKALNRGVERFSPDRSAVRDLSFDSDLTGDVNLPVLTLHAIDDPTAFVEHESAYRATLEGAGNDQHLVQTFTREAEHSSLSAAEYAAAIGNLSRWVESDKKPTPESIASSCSTYAARHDGGCFFEPSFTPESYASRVRPRPGTRHWPAITSAQYDRWERRGDVGIEP